MVHNPSDDQQNDFELPDLLSVNNMNTAYINHQKQNKASKSELKELLKDHIYTCSGAFSEMLCAEFISKIEKELQNSPYKYQVFPKRNPLYAYRNNIRISTIDPSFALDLWHLTGLSKLLARFPLPGSNPPRYPTGLHENIRLYKYAKGHRFEKHYDDFMFSQSGQRTEFTLLIYLNMGIEVPNSDSNISDSRNNTKRQTKAKGAIGAGDSIATDPTISEKPDGRPKNSLQYPSSILASVPSEDMLVGGETVFYSSRPKFQISVKPETGLLLLHKHGDDCLLHEESMGW
ncbi:hypothetical protein BB561_001310 [Smittium simulii]|uniref:Prolyl 4-hydroxylase alpha subunit domain-containing protein n=1 Tax=Smittium simulii TaxID=133385 RepID=A0A2T9YVA6_9FUNG|nr:hypothetical protein BB561_001310 [Smittium simulii]